MADAPVRVAHIITRMILGGAQESTLAICDGLRRRPGWDPVLITGPPLGPEGELLSEAARRSVPLLLLPEMRREVNPWRDAVAFLKLIRILRQVRPTIVHTHSSKAGVLGRLAAHVARVPLILHMIRGLPFHPYASPVANAVFLTAERIAARVTDHFTAVGSVMADKAAEAGLGDPDDFTVIRSGIDVSAYENVRAHREEARRRFGFSPDDVVIGKVARLFELKGHRFLVRAAPRVVDRCPTARFLFLGEGILRDELKALADRLGVRDRITFAGLVPPTEIPALVSGMDVLVHASLREGLARVLVQALLCETPVVTYDLDGAPEVIIDGVTGRLVPGESIDELADAIIWTIQHPEQAGEMAREGRRRFAREFSVEHTIETTQALYRELLRRHGLPVPLTSPPPR